MKINHSNVVLSKEYQGDFLDDTIEGIGIMEGQLAEMDDIGYTCIGEHRGM
jgi:hypothetical protein